MSNDADLLDAAPVADKSNRHEPGPYTVTDADQLPSGAAAIKEKSAAPEICAVIPVVSLAAVPRRMKVVLGKIDAGILL